MTFTEFDRRQWAWIKREEEHAKDIVSMGWWVAQLSRQQRLQSLKTLLTPARIPTPEEAAELQAYHERIQHEMGA